MSENPINNQSQLSQSINAAEILESISDGFFALNQDWRFIYINQRAASNLGLKREDYIGKNIWESFPAILGTPHEEYYRKAMLEGQSQEFEIQGVLTKKYYAIRVYPTSSGIAVYWQDITERKQMETALDSALNTSDMERIRLRAILRSIPSGVVIIEKPDGRITYINGRAMVLYGTDPRGLPMKDHSKYEMRILKPDGSLYPAQELPASRALFRGEEVRNEEMIIERLDGSRITVTASAVPIADKTGQITAAVGSFEDITEFKRTVESLKESENKFRTIFERSEMGIVIGDPKGRIIESNPAFDRLLGYENGELKGRSFAEFTYPEDLAATMTQVPEFVAGKIDSIEAEKRYIRKDGQVIWVRLFVSAIRGSRDEPLGLALIEDITHSKKAEEALAVAKAELERRVKERTEELKKSEEKYRRIIETTNEGVLIVDPNDTTIFANRQMAQMLGYTPEEMIGKKSALFVAEGLEKEAGLIDNSAIEESTRAHEFRLRRKDGSNIWVIVTVSRLFDDNGQFIGILGMNTDITRRKEMELDLNDYAQRITRIQEEERKRIAYELHDDTAQYLSILKLQLDSLLQSGKIQDPEILKKLEYLEKDAGRAVDDVRRYSHELRPAVLDNLGLQASLEQMTEDTNKLQQITVGLTLEGEEPALPDEVKLGLFRIAQEALNNARKHSGAENVNIGLYFSDNRVRLSIVDNGVGFKMPETSYRSANKGSLGLKSMQERAKLIGAGLTIESDPGQGTRISVEINL